MAARPAQHRHRAGRVAHDAPGRGARAPARRSATWAISGLTARAHCSGTPRSAQAGVGRQPVRAARGADLDGSAGPRSPGTPATGRPRRGARRPGRRGRATRGRGCTCRSAARAPCRASGRTPRRRGRSRLRGARGRAARLRAGELGVERPVDDLVHLSLEPHGPQRMGVGGHRDVLERQVGPAVQALAGGPRARSRRAAARRRRRPAGRRRRGRAARRRPGRARRPRPRPARRRAARRPGSRNGASSDRGAAARRRSRTACGSRPRGARSRRHVSALTIAPRYIAPSRRA